ncbi:MAG: DUF3054 domain-containing protein [Dehalococcoidia bacterium]|nr:DUF3054 domain-containing protein [Dehalococcoidia bacterium]
MPQKRALALALGDVASLVAFGVLGLASHEREFTAAAFARAVLPFAAAWLALGWPLGAFGLHDGRPALTGWRFAAAWLVCGTAALGARALVFDRHLLNAFFVIALAGNGLSLAAWRLAFDRLWSRRTASRGGAGAATAEGVKSW